MLINDETARINAIINQGAKTAMRDIEFFERELIEFKASPVRRDMITGENYYRGDQDIIKRQRIVIGEGGKPQAVYNLPNNKLIDNQYGKMVDQKVNYLLSKPISFKSDNEEFTKKLKEIFNRKFLKLIKNIGEDSLNGGIGWLYVYIDDKGGFSFCRFKPYEVLPFWKDADHTELDCVLRIYPIQAYVGRTKKIIEKVEIYKPEGIERYILEGSTLVADVENPSSTYFKDRNGNGYNWERLPIIAFKQNSKEIPLIKRVKSLQDALNTVRSDFMNNMQEDSRNTILVIKNYDGTDLGEFRRNLSQYGAVKVRTIDGAEGGIDTLQVEVNSSNYIAITDMLKKAIIENARGYDARDERMSNNPNQMNIQSMYSDIDLDANGTEAEYQAAFEEVLWFVKNYLKNTGQGDFLKEEVEVIFDKDQLINESEVISNCKASVGILSDETIVSQHPWVSDVTAELERIEQARKKVEEKQKEEDENSYFKKPDKVGGNNEE